MVQRHGWAERLQHGNALLRRLFPRLTDDALPDTATYDNAPLLVAPYPGARTLVISFGGNTNFLMLPQSIVTLPDAHLIAIRDPSRCFSICGLAGLGADYAACIASLRRLIDALGATRIYCTGVSAGGYPALRFGLDLGVCGVLAFSPPTTLELADDGDAPLSRYPQLTALYKQRAALGFDLDLARAYTDSEDRPGVLLLYSPSHDRDAWLANRMRGIDGVEVSAVSPEAGHRVYLWLNAQNRIPYYIERMLALQRGGAVHARAAPAAAMLAAS
jgi:pimeloyl-ACP methyl ester carboxylesterase